MSRRSRRSRLADFKLRVGYDPTAVHVLGEHGRFVTVNPMSDEHALLEKLDLDPESCIKVDLYWEHNGDVAFVQIQSTLYTNNRPPGTYVRRFAEGGLNVVIVVPDRAISSTRVVGQLRSIADTVARLNPDRVGLNLVAIPFES